jgi:hypothetical protein
MLTHIFVRPGPWLGLGARTGLGPPHKKIRTRCCGTP